MGKDRCGLVLDSLAHVEPSKMRITGAYSAVGTAHMLELCRSIGTVSEIAFHNSIPPDLPPNLIAVGGPLGNSVTKFHLDRSCPGFQPYYDEDSFVYPDGRVPAGWDCGGQRFQNSDDEVVGFVVKLTSMLTRHNGVVHLVFGKSDIGTAAAAYYLSEYTRDIYVGHRDRPYFLAIKVSRVMGYRSISSEVVDLTGPAFQALQRGSGEP